MHDGKQNDLSGNRLVAALFLLYVTAIGLACYLKLSCFQYEDFDLAVHTQSMHNMLRGSFDCSILGIPYPGNHMSISLVLIAPFYALFPSPLVLLLLQTIVLACGAIALLIYARHFLPKPYPELIAASFLVYPPLAYMNLYEFHPVAMVVTFLVLALLAYEKRKPIAYAATLLLAMSCQENISLIVVMLGIKALFDRRSIGWVAGPIAAGIAWFVVCIYWIMPQLNPGIIQFTSIYSHLSDPPAQSVTEVASAILRDPGHATAYALSEGKIAYLGSLALPLAGTPLLSPLSLLPALPALAQRLLSARWAETTILYHYQAELIPFIFLASIHGLARIRKKRKHLMPAVAVCMIALTIVSCYLANVPGTLRGIRNRAIAERHLTAVRRDMLADIPEDAAVAATFRYLPSLADRSTLHSVHHIYTGKYTLSNVSYPMPDDLDAIIMDRDDPLTFGDDGFYTKGGVAHLAKLLSTNQMSAVSESGALILFVRSAGDTR